MTLPKHMREEYQRYLVSTKWQARRLNFLVSRMCSHSDCEDAEHWHCETCDYYLELDEVEVHHKTYKTLGKERFNDLAVLCGRCHKAADEERARRGKERSKQAHWKARVDGFMIRKYGPDWSKEVSPDEAVREFEAWLEKRGWT